MNIIPASAIIPTYNRAIVLESTLKTLASQEVQFSEIIIIDASDDELTCRLCSVGVKNLRSQIIYERAVVKGAAAQRNQGYARVNNSFVAFMDDDVYLEQFCLDRLWACFEAHPEAGGVSAMITNQKYERLGALTRLMCRLLNGKALPTYAGRCIGPAWNFLPDDDPQLPEFVPVDWLNLGLTVYRVEALPNPPFQSHFHGYSMMEDLTLSLIVGEKWKLFNTRTARIFHDSQPGVHKNNIKELEKMELVNRYFIMTTVLKRDKLRDHIGLGLLEVFKILSFLRSSHTIKNIPSMIAGKIAAVAALSKRI